MYKKKKKKTSASFRLLLSLTNKMDLRRDDKQKLYQTLVYTTHGRIQKIMLKRSIQNIRKQHVMKSLKYLMHLIIYQICTSWHINHQSKSMTTEAMKVFWCTETRINREENGENVPELEIILYTFVPNNLFCQLLNISPTNHVFSETFQSDFWWIEYMHSLPITTLFC